ncbi:hypothetical protein [Fusobacterium massiliense]|uniref:hypothetical protein n=1 Tax=Fusobacterium massiliense TaxID=1852365 RepID=UPI0028D47FC0|nr:hypothetical protein [Fusobacterium massiliense]
MRILSDLKSWNDGKKITVYEEKGKLYVSDNFMTFGEKKDIDKWLSFYKIFFEEDSIFGLIKGDKKLFEMGIL